jgi:phosphate transport system substrate-binding protein
MIKNVEKEKEKKKMKVKKMKVKNKKSIIVTAIVMTMVAASALAGCGIGEAPGGGGAATKGSTGGTVVIAGSTSVQPLSEELAEIFMEQNKGIDIEVQGGGSGQGIKAMQTGIADLGALSRDVKDEESADVAETFVIAKDGVAVIVNKKSEVKGLTMEQLKAIFTGEITNWKDVGGADGTITVVSRENGSGTRTAFTELTGVTKKDANGEEKDNTVSSAIIQGSTGAVSQTVAGTDGSIGYISLGSLDDSVKAVKVEGVEASEQTVLDGSYKISRPFIYVSGKALTPAAQRWIDFVLSREGQKIVRDSGFIPVN